MVSNDGLKTLRGFSSDPYDWEPEAWSYFTRNPEKRRLYLADSYFVEGADHLAGGLGDRWPSATHAATTLLFKPEAIAGRRLEAGIEALLAHGFVLLGWRTPIVDAGLTHALWRYQLNFATVDRLLLQTVLRPNTRSLLLFLAHESKTTMPVALRLKAFKGAAVPGSRGSGTLRDKLGSNNALLNFVHSPDEPADVVREVGIWATEGGIAEILAGSCRAKCSDLAEEIGRLYAETPPHDLQPGNSRERLLDSIRMNARGADLLTLSEALSGRGLQGALTFRDLVETIRRAGVNGDELSTQWDLFVALSDIIRRDRNNVEATINDGQTGVW